jgi:hypothetical protein
MTVHCGSLFQCAMGSNSSWLKRNTIDRRPSTMVPGPWSLPRTSADNLSKLKRYHRR